MPLSVFARAFWVQYNGRMENRGRSIYPNPYRLFGALAVLITLLILILLAVTTPSTNNLLTRVGYQYWLIATGVATFILYGLDKMQAKRDGVRAPKKLLHLCALAGGVGGGWLGMILFHHKRRQMDFVLLLALATVIHLAILLWF